MSRVALEPVAHDVVVELLAPQHPGERLAHDVASVLAQLGRDDPSEERVSFRPSRGERWLEVVAHARAAGMLETTAGETELNRLRRSGRDGQLDPRRRPGAHLGWVHQLGAPLDDPPVE